MSKKLLKQKICLITGAGGGIGKVIAERFAEENAIVYANDRSIVNIDQWAVELSEKSNTPIIPIYFDLTNSEAVKQAIMRIKKEQGRIDVLINNAGLVINEQFGMVSKEEIKEIFEVNVFGLFDLMQFVARIMLRQKSGSIVNISSVVGVQGSKGQTAYSASKGAVISLTKSAAKELAPYQVRVNSVAPGMTETDRIQVSIKEKFKDTVPEIGMGRLASPADIADACLYFASDLSKFTTGQILVVGGGADTISRDFYDIKYK